MPGTSKVKYVRRRRSSSSRSPRGRCTKYAPKRHCVSTDRSTHRCLKYAPKTHCVSRSRSRSPIRSRSRSRSRSGKHCTAYSKSHCVEHYKGYPHRCKKFSPRKCLHFEYANQTFMDVNVAMSPEDMQTSAAIIAQSKTFPFVEPDYANLTREQLIEWMRRFEAIDSLHAGRVTDITLVDKTLGNVDKESIIKFIRERLFSDSVKQQWETR